MNELTIIKNDQAVTSSLIVAEQFGKDHKNVLRDIDNLMGGAQNCATLFQEETYIHPQNKQEYRMYYMNRDGFSLLAMGFTGWKWNSTAPKKSWPERCGSLIKQSTSFN